MLSFFNQAFDLNTIKAYTFAIGKNCASTSFTFSLSETKGIELRIPRIVATKELSVHLYTESGDPYRSFSCKWCAQHADLDIYRAYLGKDVAKGLYFFDFEADTPFGRVYFNKGPCGHASASYNASPSRFQLTVSEFAYEEPKALYGGIIYQIFVDRFSRGDRVIKKKGGVYPEDWSVIPEYPQYPGAPLKNNTFYGGNLLGIVKRLDYLKSLGVSAIYLTPIFKSPSNHKYDTADYMTVDEAFGGDAALQRLIKSAKEQGIEVILDGVFNHTGADSVYFNKMGTYDTIGAYNSTNSPYFDWYDFKSYPDEYTTWWGVQILPKINPDISSCRNFISGSGGVIEKYMKMGILGFRLDVVDELSDDFIKHIKETQAKHRKDSVLYGEVWEDASNKIAYDKRKSYYHGDELDGVMNYPLRRGIIDFVTLKGTETLIYALTEVYENAPKRIANLEMNLLGTHDTERILTALASTSTDGLNNDELAVKRLSESERALAKRRLIVSYTILATLPGIPMIYYGDEVGLEGYKDPFNRLPYPYENVENDIRMAYAAIGKIRRGASVYKTGEFKLLHIDENILAFLRYDSKGAYLTVANVSEHSYDISFSANAVSMTEGRESTTFKITGISAGIYLLKDRKTNIIIKNNR